MAKAAIASWPRFKGPVLDWLVGDARRLPDAASLLAGLCTRLVDAGMPLARASFHLRMLHPQLFGMGFYWTRGGDDVRVFEAEHGIQATALYQRSPMRALFEGVERIRQRLDEDGPPFAFPLFDEMKAAGLTEYVALPMTFSDGKIHGTTWTTDQPNGFDDAHLAEIEDLLPILSLLLEIHLNRHITVDLLNTYVGHHAGERILEGQITRGSSETVDAAIWLCDLRGFTAMSEHQSRGQLVDCLNRYFDVMVPPVERHGGEILKFIGDAMLAIFPLDIDRACERALEAAIEARAAMKVWNSERQQQYEDTLEFGIALHAGNVMYGNIGAANRLDFTIIGPAVNLTSRMEGMCRRLRSNIIASDTFADLCAAQFTFRSLGTQQLTDIDRPVELFTID